MKWKKRERSTRRTEDVVSYIYVRACVGVGVCVCLYIQVCMCVEDCSDAKKEFSGRAENSALRISG